MKKTPNPNAHGLCILIQIHIDKSRRNQILKIREFLPLGNLTTGHDLQILCKLITTELYLIILVMWQKDAFFTGTSMLYFLKRLYNDKLFLSLFLWIAAKLSNLIHEMACSVLYPNK